MVIGQLINMKYRLGPLSMVKAPITSANFESLGKEESKIAPDKIAIATENTKQPPLLGCLSVMSSPVLLQNLLSSVKVTLLNRRTTSGVPMIVVQKITPAIFGKDSLREVAARNPELKANQKIRFQKLSLLRRALMKPTFGWAGALGLSYMPPYSFGTGLASKGLFFDKYLEKSSIDLLLLYNLWLGLYNFIISKYNRKAKLLKALIIWFAFSLCITTTAKAETTGVESNMVYKVAALNKANQQELTHVQTKELITVIERIYSIPSGLLTAIAEVESAFDPYVLGVGGKSLKFDNKEAAIAKLEELAQQGITNIDVGVMQINLKWHQGKFQSLEEMLTPFKNIEYAAKLLASLHKQYGDWHKAVRIYHSKKREHHLKYSKKVVLAWLNSSAQGN
jgi:hypothetical protein